MSLVLRNLEFSDEAAFFEGMKHWQVKDLSWYTFIWKPGMSFAEMLKILENERQGINLAQGRVPHSMLYGFVDGVIVGRVSLRHSLNENLRKRGGNMGYAVAEPFRRNGYATEMVRLAIEYCRGLGMSKILVTCADENIPSWKIIEKFNGQLQDRVWDDEDQEMIRRYWISLAK